MPPLVRTSGPLVKVRSTHPPLRLSEQQRPFLDTPPSNHACAARGFPIPLCCFGFVFYPRPLFSPALPSHVARRRPKALGPAPPLYSILPLPLPQKARAPPNNQRGKPTRQTARPGRWNARAPPNVYAAAAVGRPWESVTPLFFTCRVRARPPSLFSGLCPSGFVRNT
jgi:hypothetical protein